MAIDPREYVIKLLEGKDLDLILEDAKDWAHCHGLAFRTPEHKDQSDVCQIAPFSLLPSAFPKGLFEQAIKVQEAMNLLYFRISWDYYFLLKSHEAVIKTDEFTRKMMEILTKVHNEGYHQKNILLTQRADYMAHQEEDGSLSLKQIEVNNIAVSMGGLTQRVTELYRRLLKKFGMKEDEIKKSVIPNRPVDTLAQGIYRAWLLFNDPEAVILTVIEDVNQNQLDQRFIEYAVEELSNGTVRFVRATLTECSKRLSLSPKFDLLIDGSTKVALVYFRAGYQPNHYPTEAEWDARLNMERSTAIKCPSIGLQLANTKKIQQVLNEPEEVERFFPQDKQTAELIRATFAGLWGLEKDDEETEKVIKDAIENPHLYVFKPQLEGGAGNFFGEEISKMLTDMTKDERAAYILMQNIKPLVVKNILVRAFQPVQLGDVVSELGIYGYLIGNGDDARPKTNFSHGHILRTKTLGVKEGGVAVGAAVIDSPFLY